MFLQFCRHKNVGQPTYINMSRWLGSDYSVTTSGSYPDVTPIVFPYAGARARSTQQWTVTFEFQTARQQRVTTGCSGRPGGHCSGLNIPPTDAERQWARSAAALRVMECCGCWPAGMLHVDMLKCNGGDGISFSLSWKEYCLTHCGLMTPYDVTGLCQHRFRQWLVACTEPSHCPKPMPISCQFTPLLQTSVVW